MFLSLLKFQRMRGYGNCNPQWGYGYGASSDLTQEGI